MRAVAVAGLLLLLQTVAGCFDSDDDGPVQPGDGSSPVPEGWALEPFVDGLESPVYLTHAGDESGRIFIVERGGAVKIWEDGAFRSQPFMDVASLIVTGSGQSEQGLLGLAFHPEFESNGYLFVHYTRNGPNPVDDGDIVVARYQVAANDPNSVNPSSARVLLVVDHESFGNHNGGQLAFGPDGYLYIGLGDGGGFGDPYDNGQSRLALLGKILRIDVDNGNPYSVPSDNPFNDGINRGEIWVYGIRNPWRFSFDRETGDLFIADVGQDVWEEINFQSASSEGGENYGWDIYEGNHQYEPGVALTEAIFPVAEYDHDLGCSVTGGYVYRGQAIPSLSGLYIVGDYCSGTIWSLAHEGDEWTMEVLVESGMAISSFGEDEDGELYVLDLGGSVKKFEPA